MTRTLGPTIHNQHREGMGRLMLHSILLQRPLGQLLQSFFFPPWELLAVDPRGRGRLAFVADDEDHVNFSAVQAPFNLVDARFGGSTASRFTRRAGSRHISDIGMQLRSPQE